MKVSWDYYTQHMEKYSSCSKPPTSNVILDVKNAGFNPYTLTVSLTCKSCKGTCGFDHEHFKKKHDLTVTHMDIHLRKTLLNRLDM